MPSPAPIMLTPTPARPTPSVSSLPRLAPGSSTGFLDALDRASRPAEVKEAPQPEPKRSSESAKASRSSKSRRTKGKDREDDRDDDTHDAGRTEEAKTAHVDANDSSEDTTADSSSGEEITFPAQGGKKPHAQAKGDEANQSAGAAAAAAQSAQRAQPLASASGAENASGDGAAQAGGPPVVQAARSPQSPKAPGDADGADGAASESAVSDAATPNDVTLDSATSDGDSAAKDASAPLATAATLGAQGPKLGAAAFTQPANATPQGVLDAQFSDSADAQSAAGGADTANSHLPADLSSLDVSDDTSVVVDAPTAIHQDKPEVAPPELALSPQQAAVKPGPSSSPTLATPPPPAPPEARFAQANHAQLVTAMRGQLLPNGGSMHLRLDPPELGDLQISVQMRDGQMTAAFQTSNDQATRLLSHSLGDLKSMLESQGVSVQRLHVEQAPREQQGSGESSSGRHQPTPEDQQSARREQQRKDLVQKMWDKLLRGGSPVDLVG